MIYQLDSIEHDVLKPYVDLIRGNRSRECDWFVAEGRWVVERLIASDHEILSVVIGDQVSIPMSGCTDSLNVTHAAAILLYQFTRVSPNGH